MAKLKSQWEFGELFPTEAIRKVLTVSELTGSVRRVLEKEIGTVWVSGEISNLKIQSSGHIYFSIKDANAQLSCVLFRNEARLVQRDFLIDGQKVILQGELIVYEARGQYQLRVLSVQLQGIGALQASFERLKQKLSAEGLFDQGHKRPIPRYPQTIGLITSPTGAAIRDVTHTIQRRHPSLQIIFIPCRVQGPGAAQELAAAVNLLNDWAESNPGQKPDLILLTRGGGSLEDLWGFNEEILARAVYSSALPVISAVGHEIDFTISDFVADLRAATPTAAAEIITEGIFSSRDFMAGAHLLLARLVREHLESMRDSLQTREARLLRLHPRKRLHDQMQYLDDLQNSLHRCLRTHFREKVTHWKNLKGRWDRLRPTLQLEQRREKLRNLSDRLETIARRNLQLKFEQFRVAQERLRLLSPLNVLERGYSITRSTTGKVLRSPDDVQQGEEIITRLHSGELRSTVKMPS